MKLKTAYSLIISLILTIGYLPNVTAVTDAELDALERQIEQQEAEEKRKAEAKRIEEQKRKANAEAEKKRAAELEKQRREEEERLLEETRLIELEQQRQEEEAKKQKIQEQTKEISVNSCSKIIGVWRWDDLTRTITRYYEDGKVVSKNILKSEGTWECIEPKNRIFTSNTWGKKKRIKMSDDTKQLESTNAFTGLKLIGIKISDNPFEKIVPAKNSSSNTPGL